MKLPTTRSRAWRVSWPVLTACVAVSLAACSAGANGADNAKQDAKAPILVWTDATRKPAFEAYQKAHPNTNLKIEVVDPGSVLSKIQLANRVGKGWPDVMFDPDPNHIASLASPLFSYAQQLDKLVPKNVQDGFATHNAACTVDGKLVCLQNDLAQDVLYVNKPLMAKFGYGVPKTWTEYQQLGAKVSKEHPGYVLGAVGDNNILYEYFWGSQCPVNNVKGANEVQINTKDSKCARVASLLDPMLANGSVSRLSPFDPAFVAKAKAGKLLMTPGPSWFGEYVLKAKTTYALPQGQIAVAAEPLWDGESVNYSGAWGGGIYVVSSHAKNKAGAVDVAQWVTTDPTYQKSAPTYPAYAPVAKAWLEAVAKDPWYAEDPSAVFTDAASKISPSVVAVRYQIPPALNSTVIASVKKGGTIASALPDLQTQLSSLAQTVGYEVTE